VPDGNGAQDTIEMPHDAVRACLAQRQTDVEADHNDLGSLVGPDEDSASHLGTDRSHVHRKDPWIVVSELSGADVIGPRIAPPQEGLARRGEKHNTSSSAAGYDSAYISH
jgi:hypothetical protein